MALQAREARYRAWCFTLNNYTEEDFDSWSTLREGMKYTFVGREIAPTTGTPHLQGYMVFCEGHTFDWVKKYLGDRYRFVHCKGNASQNVKYCGKEEDCVECGVRPRPGRRTDILAVQRAFDAGVRIDEIIRTSTSYQAAKHAELLFKYQKQPPSKKRVIKWYYGSTGTGKTRAAINESPDDYYITMKDLKWWDGYIGQKVVIIDDFRRDFCTFHELLRIVDRYPYRVNTKGSSIWLQPSTDVIIFTSCFHPTDVYDTREDIQQFLRRLDVITEFK